MNWFKRLCLFVFGLAGILSLVALSLVWVGPWTDQARSLISNNRIYFTALEVMVCLTGVGLLLCVLSALFSPRNPKESVVAEVPGGEITITRAAVVSQVRHVMEQDGTCEPASIRVRMHRRGRIRVFVRVRPHAPMDIVECGARLYEDLEKGLAKVCGESVQSIDLVFTEPYQIIQPETRVTVENSSKSSKKKPVTKDPMMDGQEITLAMDAYENAPNQPDANVESDSSATIDKAENTKQVSLIVDSGASEEV